MVILTLKTRILVFGGHFLTSNRYIYLTGISIQQIFQLVIASANLKHQPYILGAGQAVWNIQQYGAVAYYIPQLFPKQFEQFVGSPKSMDEDEEDDKRKKKDKHQQLEVMEKALKEKPWIFAFRKVRPKAKMDGENLFFGIV